MKRLSALALVAAMAAAGGCASSAKYIEKKADSGIVAVPDATDTWPSNNRRAALDLIEKHVGPNYEIVDQRTVQTGRTATRTTLPDTNESLNPRNQALPAKRATGMAATTREEITEYQITYRKKESRPEPFINDFNYRGVTVGVTPAGGTTVQTQYPPTAQPAGGPSSVFNRNTVQPAGGAACDH